MSPADLLKDYATNKRFGSIEFVYKGGNIVFVRKVETLITAPYEKNSMEAPTRGEHGVNHRISNEAI